MYYHQQQQHHAAMLQQYNSHQGFSQFVPVGLNTMMNPAAAAAMYQQNVNYTFQPQPQQLYMSNNGPGV